MPKLPNDWRVYSNARRKSRKAPRKSRALYKFSYERKRRTSVLNSLGQFWRRSYARTLLIWSVPLFAIWYMASNANWPEYGADRRLVGFARIIDGDTISIRGTRIRLFGIDAPEGRQKCTDAKGVSWNCGTSATQALSKLIGFKEVRCDNRGRDRYDRTLSVCYVGDLDVNGAMVSGGHAWAYTRYSFRYWSNQWNARWSGIGVWQASNMPPWEYRWRHRR